METRGANTLLTTLLYASNAKENKNSFSANTQGNSQNNASQTKDIVRLSSETANNILAGQKNKTQLVSDTTQELENGYRRTQEFERGDGKSFTRIEEFTTTENRARRSVVQQNISGSTTLLEDVFDRKEDGSFRLTQRYTNEAGETSVNIDPNAAPPTPDVILGRAPSANASSTVTPSRGGELDLIT